MLIAILISFRVFVTYNRNDCPRQQTELGERQELVRGAGVGRKLGMSRGGGVLERREGSRAQGDRGQRDPLLSDSQSEIRRTWFCQVRTA